MEKLKIVIQALSIIITIIIYISIWWSMIVNWNRCMKIYYTYPCWEKFLGVFYDIWITIHIGLIVFIFVWAWC